MRLHHDRQTDKQTGRQAEREKKRKKMENEKYASDDDKKKTNFLSFSLPRAERRDQRRKIMIRFGSFVRVCVRAYLKIEYLEIYILR